MTKTNFILFYSKFGDLKKKPKFPKGLETSARAHTHTDLFFNSSLSSRCSFVALIGPLDDSECIRTTQNRPRLSSISSLALSPKCLPLNLATSGAIRPNLTFKLAEFGPNWPNLVPFCSRALSLSLLFASSSRPLFLAFFASATLQSGSCRGASCLWNFFRRVDSSQVIVSGTLSLCW